MSTRTRVDTLAGPIGISLTVNPEVVLPLLFSSGVDGDARVPAGVADQSAAEGQHSATRQHLGHPTQQGTVRGNTSTQPLCSVQVSKFKLWTE